jgi:hypothetical protein
VAYTVSYFFGRTEGGDNGRDGCYLFEMASWTIASDTRSFEVAICIEVDVFSRFSMPCFFAGYILT